MNNNNQIEEKLAGSLTAETTDLLPYLPYLLQDLWELGSDPQDMTKLISQHIDISSRPKVIDLGCGKGPVSVTVSKALGLRVKGIDLLPEFIETAKIKAKEHGVDDLCEFTVGDINESVKNESGYDITILGAVGDVLGAPKETLEKLKAVTRPGGYIIIDEAYLTGDMDDVKYHNYEYLTLSQWYNLFQQLDLELIAERSNEESNDLDEINDYNNKMIQKRANELMKKYPDKKALFEGYVKSQLAECDDLDDTVAGVTWLLKRV